MSNPVTPVVANHCIGTNADGTPNIQMKCKLSNGNFNCSTWRFFYNDCPKINQLCSATTGGWVAAITVCNQALF